MGVVWAVELSRDIESNWFVSEVQNIFDSKEKAEKWVIEHERDILDQCSVWENPELVIREYTVL